MWGKKSKQTCITKLNIISVSWKAGFRFHTVFCTRARNIQVLLQEPPPGVKYVPLLVSNKRAQCVHPLCKPLLSKTFSQQSFCFTQAQPYPALLCPGEGLLFQDTDSAFQLDRGGTATAPACTTNKYTSSHSPGCLMCQIMRLHLKTKVIEEANQKKWYGFDLTVCIPGVSHSVSSSLQEVRVTVLEGQGSEWRWEQESCHMTGLTFKARPSSEALRGVLLNSSSSDFN